MWYYISHRGRYLSWPSLHTFTCVSESLFGTHLTCSSSPSRHVCWSSCCCGAPRAETTQFSKHSQLCVVGTRHGVTVTPHCGTGFGKAGIKLCAKRVLTFPNVRRAGSSTFRTSRCVSASCAPPPPPKRVELTLLENPVVEEHDVLLTGFAAC